MPMTTPTTPTTRWLMSESSVVLRDWTRGRHIRVLSELAGCIRSYLRSIERLLEAGQ